MHNLKRLTRDETEHGNDYYLAAEVDKLIAAEQAASVQPVAWIDCKVQMPPPGVRVFFLHKDYDRVGFDTWFGDDFRWTPSHWMPIPPLTTTPPAAQPAVPEEIMHWDGDDGEDGPHDDIASLLNNMLGNRDLEVGEKIHITRATRLPDVWVRVTKIPEDADVEYEVITTAAPEKGGAA